jgi:hypothetical protein
MELFKDTHLVKLELLSNATTIDNALHYIRNKQQQKGGQLALNLTSATAATGATTTANNGQPVTGGRQTIF